MTEKERAYLDQLVDLKKTGLPGSVLGAAAENYVRWYFKNERLRHRYRIVTPRKKLGNVIDTYGKNRLDLTVVDLEDQDSMYCVSVKNERDAIENRSKWIGDVIAMSKAHGGKPWLIASFITADGIRACEEQGVRCTAIGARIKPAETSDGRLTGVLIRKLRPILGVEPWRTVFIDRIKSADFDEDFMSRLDTARTV